jgi:hypothetical protein
MPGRKIKHNIADEGLWEIQLNSKGDYNQQTWKFLKDFKLYIILTKCNKHNNNKIAGLNSVNNRLSSVVRFYYHIDLLYDKSYSFTFLE